MGHSLDDTNMHWNTELARAEAVRAPSWMEGQSLSTFPGGVPNSVAEWVANIAESQNLLADPRGLLLYGPAGRGKTGLGCAALKALASAGIGRLFQWNIVTGSGARMADVDDPEYLPPCMFKSWFKMAADERSRPREAAPLYRELDAYVRVLMLDDIDITGKMTSFQSGLFTTLLEWGYGDGKWLILTMNSGPAEWLSLYGERAWSRMNDPRRFLKIGLAGDTLR